VLILWVMAFVTLLLPSSKPVDAVKHSICIGLKRCVGKAALSLLKACFEKLNVEKADAEGIGTWSWRRLHVLDLKASDMRGQCC
jgi:hypothetical protein